MRCTERIGQDQFRITLNVKGVQKGSHSHDWIAVGTGHIEFKRDSGHRIRVDLAEKKAYGRTSSEAAAGLRKRLLKAAHRHIDQMVECWESSL